MKNFISPHIHLSSFLTGSTLESMVNKAKELGTGYCVCTDNGYLTNALKAYNYIKKNKLKPIIGCEIYFKDETSNKKIKYYTITLHAKNQEAFQLLVGKISETDRPTIDILEEKYPVFNWADLEDFSKKDFTAVIGGPQDIVCKNLLVDDNMAAAEVFKRLHGLFKNNLYSSIIPFSFDKKWVTNSIFTFSNGTTATLDSSIMADTAYTKNFRVSLEEVANNPSRHKIIKRIYINGVGYNVNKDIVSALNTKNFDNLSVDIYKKYNSFIKAMSNRFGVPMLISDYSYLADESDKLVQDLKLGEAVRIPTKNYIRKTEDVLSYLQQLFSQEEIEKLVENSYKWASNFDQFKLEYTYRLVKEHDNSLTAAMDLIKKVGRFDFNNEEHRKRLKHEIDVIHANGKIDLLPYFFPINTVLGEYVNRGKVVGPARGSAGGSFLLYCMGITQIDPLKYGLYFSRFLTLGRILSGSLPDVDVDLPNRELLTMEGGLLDTYYKNRWAQISTRSLMRLKSSIRDVNRFKKGKVEDEIEKFAKSLEATPQGVTDKAFVFGYEDNEKNHIPGLIEKDPKLKAYIEQRPDEWAIVEKTLGISRQNGRHASAFVISDIPITQVVPTMEVAGVKNVTQYEAKEIEEAGLIKYDFLVVKCLNDIELAIKYINKHNFYDNGNVGDFKAGYFFHKGEMTYIWDLPEEAEVFDMLAEGKTETVFQLNTTSVTPFVQKMKPRSVSDIAVVTSLVRPGPLDFIDPSTGRNMAEEYIERVNGRSKGDIEILDRLLPETKGVFVFQEQLTRVVKDMTGWDDEKAEDVRIAVGKKKLALIMELAPQFIKASIEKGIDEDTAKKVWGMIETFGRYGFNKSHAVAYSMIAYACSYLKHHYPLEWWAAVLSNAEEKEITEVLWPYVKDILSPPDINLSNEEMVIDYKTKTIRNKLSILRGLGPKVANKIIEFRPFKDINDFVEKEAAGESLTKKLIHVGVLDSLFPANTPLMDKMQAYEDALEIWAYKKKILEKSDYEVAKNQPIESFIEAAKLHPKTKKCKHEIPKGKIDLNYAWMNPIKDFILKKSIFPTMPMVLSSIIVNCAKNVKVIGAESASYAINSFGAEVRLVNGKMYQNIKNLPPQPGTNKIVEFCVSAYVVDSKEFAYKDGEKKALKLIVDIDGYIEELVLWPNYDTGILTYPENLKKNTVVFIFMTRNMSKEVYHTNISSIVVEDALST